ncbi:MAG: CinA family protein [Chloroflexi bacterium]|nr:CinA family protein [Chloroflexota bacterium]
MAMLLESDTLASEIGELLAARAEKVAVSETTAGGLISARMLSVPAASRWFESAIVPYSSPTKFEALGMDREIAREHGAVSAQWVTATADAVRRMTGVAWGVAESGIAGPQGSRRSPKPVGSVAIAVIGPNGSRAEEHVFVGTRVQVMEQITQRALEMLLEALKAG